MFFYTSIFENIVTNWILCLIQWTSIFKRMILSMIIRFLLEFSMVCYIKNRFLIQYENITMTFWHLFIIFKTNMVARVIFCNTYYAKFYKIFNLFLRIIFMCWMISDTQDKYHTTYILINKKQILKIKTDWFEIIRRNILTHFTQHQIVWRRFNPKERLMKSKQIFLYN